MAQFIDPKNDLTFKRVFGENNELWLRFLTEINEKTEDVPQELLDNDYIREAITYMERSAYTKEQLDAYYQWKIDTITAQSMIENAEAKGEANTHKKVIANCVRAGYSVEIISTITGLTPEEVMQIIEKEESKS